MSTVLIATIVCCLTIAIQNSFHKLLSDQMRTASPYAIIIPKQGYSFFNKHKKYLDKMNKNIQWAPVSYKYLLATKDNENFYVAIIKFIDPKKACHILSQREGDVIKSSTRGVIIGSGLQSLLTIGQGETVQLILLEKNRKRRSVIKPIIYGTSIEHIITTGVEEIDSRLIICSYALGKKFVSDLSVDEIELLIEKDDVGDYENEIRALQKNFPELQIQTYKDLHSAFFATVALECYVTQLYLFLLFLFVFITHVALVVMQAIYNQKKVTILLFLGMRKKILYTVILFLMISKTVIVSVIGICIARLAAYWITINTPNEIQLAYQIKQIPIHFSANLIVTIIAIMVFITSITACCMFFFLSRYNTMHILKNET